MLYKAEMVERQVIQDILIKRQQKKHEVQKIIEARGQLPDIRDGLEKLFKTHFTPAKEAFHPNMLNGTKLKCTISAEDQNILVTITCDQYPLEGVSTNAIYTIDVEDFDYEIVIQKDRGILVSKEKESNMPKDLGSIVIGMKYDYWSKWEREMKFGDYYQCLDLLKTIEDGKTKIVPSIIPQDLDTRFSH